MPGIELNWPNKNRVLYEVPQRGQGKPTYYGDPGTPSWPDHRPLLRVSTHGDPDADPNRLIQGDNLVGLQALLDEGMAGRFKCIYIDPPFNTDTAFEHYDDSFEKTIWLGMMRDRLKLLYKLLHEEGTICVHIDDNELGYLNLLLDQQFGRSNRVSLVTFKQGSATGHKSINPGLVTTSNFLLFYAKDKSRWKSNRLYTGRERDKRYGQFIVNFEEDYQDWRFITLAKAFASSLGLPEKDAKKIENYEERISEFVIENADRVTQLAAPNYDGVSAAAREMIDRSLAHPKKIYKLQRQDYSDIFLVGGKRILFYSNKLKIVDGVSVAGEPLTTMWDDLLSNNLHNEGGVEFPKGKKPEALLQRIINFTTNEGDWVLDSFVGSGTTAAVASQMNRRWVTIEMGGHAETHCLPRLEKARIGAAPYKLAAGGGFVFEKVGPPLVIHDDALGIQKMNPEYVNGTYQRAVCLLTGFKHQPDDPVLHGRATADGGRFCHIAERGVLVTEEYLHSIRQTLETLAHANGQDMSTCVVYATKTATDGGEGVEVVRIPAGFTSSRKRLG